MPLQDYDVSVTNWFLQVDGTQMASFKTIGGISLELNVVETQQVVQGGKTVLRKSVNANGLKGGKLTCSRGLVLDDSMWLWIQEVIEGRIVQARKNISVILFDSMDGEIKRYNFRNAWPSGWSLGDLDSGGADALMETMTIEHEGFSLAGKNGM